MIFSSSTRVPAGCWLPTSGYRYLEHKINGTSKSADIEPVKVANNAPNVAAKLPLEFIVKGVPRSIHAKNSLRGWIQTVKDAATAAWGDDQPLGTELNVTIVYFYRAGSIDVDNFIKPILDAMNRVIYDDDELVSQVLARKTELRSGLEIGTASTGLVAALDAARDFVLVRVNGPPDHGAIP